MTPITTISDLHALPNWVVFAQEPQPAGGKPKKIPYTPATNHRAKVNDPRTWCGGWWRPRLVLRRRSASCPVIHQGFLWAWQTHLQATPACSGARSHRHCTLLGSLGSHPAFPGWHLIVVRFAADLARSKRERQMCPRVSARAGEILLGAGFRGVSPLAKDLATGQDAALRPGAAVFPRDARGEIAVVVANGHHWGDDLLARSAGAIGGGGGGMRGAEREAGGHQRRRVGQLGPGPDDGAPGG